MLSLIIPVYKNEGSIADLLQTVGSLSLELANDFEAIFVVDGSPDKCYELLRCALPEAAFRSTLILLSRNFGSFSAIRVGLQHGNGDLFAVMAADLQEPPELVLQMSRVLRQGEADVVVGTRQDRNDPVLTKLMSSVFWSLYRRWVVREMPPGGVDIFACNREFRDSLLALEERHSSLVAQIFWLGFRRETVGYVRRVRRHGRSAWTLRRKIDYLMDSTFAFTDLPIRILTRSGALGVLLAGTLGLTVLVARLVGAIDVPGYAMTMIMIFFFGGLNLLGLGIIGSYAWRTYENTKRRPLAIPMKVSSFGDMHE